MKELDQLLEQIDDRTRCWPENAHERGLEKFVETDLFVLVLKPVRTSKPGRELLASAIRNPDIKKRFFPENIIDVYLVTVEPMATAGHHYHRQKIEAVFPQDGVEIHFENIQSGEKSGLYIPERSRYFQDTTYGVIIKPGIAHAIRNPSLRHKAKYSVLSNMLEEDANRSNDIIAHQIEINRTRLDRLP